jgi:hypothetical protein
MPCQQVHPATEVTENTEERKTVTAKVGRKEHKELKEKA